MLAHRNDDILALNTVIHERRAEAGLLGPDVAVTTTNGDRTMAAGDRLLFLKNADLVTASGQTAPVSNSDLGTILSVKDGIPVKDGGTGPVLTVAIDGGKTVTFDAKSYPDFDLGYATTIHKSQGETVDRVIVLASSSMDKSLAYVAMSRHRDEVKVFVPQSEIADLKALTWSFSRTSPKLTTLDYAEQRGVGPKPVIPVELSPLVKAGHAVVEAARQAFDAVKAKFEAVVAAVQTRLAPALVVATPAAVPAVAVQPTGAALGPVAERAEPPVAVTPPGKPVVTAEGADMAKPEPSVPDGAKTQVTPERAEQSAAVPWPPKESSISRLAEKPTGTAPSPVVERAGPPVAVTPPGKPVMTAEGADTAMPEPSVPDGTKAQVAPARAEQSATPPRPPRETPISRLAERVAVVKSIMVDIEARGLAVRPDLQARMHDARAALEAGKPGPSS